MKSPIEDQFAECTLIAEQYAAGILTVREFTEKIAAINATMPPFQPGEIDPNTGLKYK